MKRVRHHPTREVCKDIVHAERSGVDSMPVVMHYLYMLKVAVLTPEDSALT